MENQDFRAYVDLGLVAEEEYSLFLKVMQEHAPKTPEERRSAFLAFLHECGDISQEEYQSSQ